LDSKLDLPSNPTPEQLELIQRYLSVQNRGDGGHGYGKQNYYIDKTSIIDKKLIIFKHKQKKKDVWYMRFYVGNKKYKTLSLGTSDKGLATELALEKWRTLKNQIEVGGVVFESTTEESIDLYLDHLKELVDTEQIKKLTLTCKRTSLKKLRVYLQDHQRPSQIPLNVLEDYTKWRRTKNWDKNKHPNNPKPPTDQTINRELCDFKGYFDWMKKKKLYPHEVDYPFIKVDHKRSVESNPSFDVDDWMTIVYYMRTWVRKNENRKEYGIFYRTIFCEFLKVLANSGLRPHEALKLRWTDIQLKKKEEVEFRQSSKTERELSKDLNLNQIVEGGGRYDVSNEDGYESDVDVRKNKVVRERLIAHIEVSPDTKTGRRLVICPAGVYFRRIRNFYKDKTGSFPKPNDFIFMNIGTTHSKKMDFVGRSLSTDHLRKLWYELMNDLKVDKDVHFNKNYTMYSCRSFFINQRLEMGVPPNYVAKLVGHSIKTMERHYENIQLKNLEPELVEVRKKKLEQADFQTYDLELG
jgi:integrase